MQPSSATAAPSRVVRLPRPAQRRTDTEFLPAALEIIETPASPAGRAIAGTIIALIAGSVAWASFGQVDIVATTQGRLIPTGKSKVIQPFETGVVRAIRVADGDTVRPGDVLVELDPTSDASDETRLAFALGQDRLDVARLRALLAGSPQEFAPPAGASPRLVLMAKGHMEAQTDQQAAKIDGLGRQIEQKGAEGREIAEAIGKLEASLPLVSEQRDIRQKLLGNQYGSRLSYLQVQQQVVETQHELEAQRQRREENLAAISALDRQRAEAEADFRKGLLGDLAKAEVSASEHAEEVRKAALKRDLRTLRAPVAGTVQQLAVHTLGGVVTPAQQLMVVVPEGARLEIEATLANKDVGFVHKGQEVEIKVEAFSFTRYGLIHGHVTSLSQDAIASTDAGSDGRGGRNRDGEADLSDERDRQARQPAYVAHIAVEATGIMTEYGFAPLEPGMASTAEIKTGRRTVISYLLSSLSRLSKESLRER